MTSAGRDDRRLGRLFHYREQDPGLGQARRWELRAPRRPGAARGRHREPRPDPDPRRALDPHLAGSGGRRQRRHPPLLQLPARRRTFTAPQEVTGAGIHVALPTTAMDAAGNALTVFVRAPGEELPSRLRIPTGRRGVRGPAGDHVRHGPVPAGRVRRRRDRDRRLDLEHRRGRADSARRPPGGDFGAIEPVSAGGVFFVREAVAPGGRALLVWPRYNGTNQLVEAALAEPGGEFGPAATMSTPGSSPPSRLPRSTRPGSRSPPGGTAAPAITSGPPRRRPVGHSPPPQRPRTRMGLRTRPNSPPTAA